MTIKANLNEKLKNMDKAIQNLEHTARQYAAGIGRDNAFLSAFRKYSPIQQLTRAMLVELVREIRIHEDAPPEIQLHFQQERKALIEYLDMNQDALEEGIPTK